MPGSVYLKPLYSLPLTEREHGEPSKVGVDARLHGEVADEGVEEDVLAVEQLLHFGTDFGGLDVGVVLKIQN